MLEKYFIANGKCLYDIVLPQSPDRYAVLAAEELKYVIEKCCGTAPAVVTDCETAGTALHIGDTRKAKHCAPKYDRKELGSDGFRISEADGDVFLTANGCGLFYAACEFLHVTLGSEFFHYGEYKIPRLTEAVLPALPIVKVPDIETRKRDLSWSTYDAITERRLGFNVGNDRYWVTWAHSVFELIPKAKHFANHRDWYSPDGNQLCLTNPHMIAEMKRSVIKRLTPKLFGKYDVLYVMIGHEDNGSFCDCPRCKAEAEKYGGKSGVMMRFINTVADSVNEFTEKHHPGKTVKIVTFGYGPTVLPPVVEADGAFVPVDPSVIAHDHVCVMLAPLGSDWAYSLIDEEHNKVTRRALLGWQAIGAELFIWTYDSIFDDSFIYLDNWEHLSESYRLFKNIGAVYVFDQGDSARGFPFGCLRDYVRGRLMWDLNADVKQLAKHFCENYYKDAAPEIIRYLKMLYEHFADLKRNYREPYLFNPSYTWSQPNYRSELFWPREFLERSIELLESCRDGLEVGDFNSPRNRVEMEMLSPVYLLLEIYAYRLDKETLKKHIDFFERVTAFNGLDYTAEHGPTHTKEIFRKLVNWRSVLYDEGGRQ